ncbi:hypothetical protein TIFTF001_027844 [Ficus carica]|uniref:Uncharacterized protein n=1 Tax=Ficus carica TaxID=3494 RepID=A0AA88IVN6_FICCA|nr:hypothetical protein TIFTF001_027844 [Ficus carica]
MGSRQGQNLKTKSKSERRKRPTNRSACQAADGGWDGGAANRATDSSTWAPVWRTTIFANRRRNGCDRSAGEHE